MRITFSLLNCFGGLIVAGFILPDVRAQEVDDPGTQPKPATVAKEHLDDLDDLFSNLTDTTATSQTATTETKADTVSEPSEFDKIVGPSKELDESKSDSTVTDTVSDQTGTPSTVVPETKSVPATVPPATAQSQEELTPELAKLRERVRDCLGYYYNQQESVVDHSPWGVMHILIAYGVDTQVYAHGQKTNAISYLCYNGNCRGQQLFFLNRGRLETRIGPGVQGHDGQFLAMMAQSKVKIDYPMHVEGKNFTIADLVEYEKRTCEAGTELTFKLIGLSHYLDTETKWKNNAGEPWSLSRLIKEELSQPIIGAACGGTHRLMGFNYAVRKREKEGKPMDGQWLRARKFLDDYFEYTFYLQNQDASFSTDFFRGRNSYGDVNQRIETTGHILEWFLASLSEKQLRDERVVRSVDYLTRLMMQNRNHEWEIGPKGHALHALAIYSERVFGDKPGTREQILARGRKVQTADQKQR